MTKILKSVAVIGFVAAIAVAGTGAYFSDTETSTGNTFTAGAIDLKVDSQCHYWQDNGADEGYVDVGCKDFGTWTETDLTLSHKFFNFGDVKPGDKGENTISLHPIDNDAYICAYVTNLVSADNSQTEPEALVDANGLTAGELQNNIHLNIWTDNGVVGADGQVKGACDNLYQQGEAVLVQDTVIDNNMGGWLLGQVKGDTTSCLGVAWNVPTGVGNEIQTDSVSADISFYAEQVRNNPNFVCPATLPTETPVPTPTPEQPAPSPLA
jgi:predicted ribosomally synthesized peptide with SipW-like signal peptide